MVNMIQPAMVRVTGFCRLALISLNGMGKRKYFGYLSPAAGLELGAHVIDHGK